MAKREYSFFMFELPLENFIISVNWSLQQQNIIYSYIWYKYIYRNLIFDCQAP